MMIGTALIKNPPAGCGHRTGSRSPAPRAGSISRHVRCSRRRFTSCGWHCLGTTAGQMAISQLGVCGSAGLGALAATLVLPVSATGNAGGHLSGWMSDRLGRLLTLKTMIIISALAMPALFLWREQALLFSASCSWSTGAITQLSVCVDNRGLTARKPRFELRCSSPHGAPPESSARRSPAGPSWHLATTRWRFSPPAHSRSSRSRSRGRRRHQVRPDRRRKPLAVCQKDSYDPPKSRRSHRSRRDVRSRGVRASRSPRRKVKLMLMEMPACRPSVRQSSV